MFQSVAREYFSSSNFLNRRILTDIATVEKSYDGKWNELQEKEKEKVGIEEKSSSLRILKNTKTWFAQAINDHIIYSEEANLKQHQVGKSFEKLAS